MKNYDIDHIVTGNSHDGLQIINIPEKPEKSGFFDLPELPESCRDPQHQPPMHLVIPPGKGYRHVCPKCGAVKIMYSQNHTL